jgi:hypothetical protein
MDLRVTASNKAGILDSVSFCYHRAGSEKSRHSVAHLLFFVFRIGSCILTPYKGGIFMRYCVFVVGLLLVASFAFGADVDGKWTGSVAGMDGNNMTIAYTFKAEGTTLTGFHIFNGTETPIKDGKIDGNNISFSVTLDFGGQEMKLEHKGVVSADQIKLTYDMMGQPGEMILKRAK